MPLSRQRPLENNIKRDIREIYCDDVKRISLAQNIVVLCGQSDGEGLHDRVHSFS